MEFIKTEFKDLYLIKPTIFGDERGYFYESFNDKNFKENTGIDINFVQDNQSLSKENVLRGLHFQNPPFAQDKLVRVIQGSVIDVVLDVRKNEPTYGKTYAVEISAKNNLQLFVPKGFAHGFVTLEDDTIFAYKCSDYYSKNAEECILWNDTSLNINWGISIEQAIISDKDKEGKLFVNFMSPF